LESSKQAERIMHLKGSNASWQAKGIKKVFDHLLDKFGNIIAIGCKGLHAFTLE
jgi:hypothetical protein